MNLRARLSERVHIEDIREVLHFIQDDERLREEVYQLIFDKDHIVSYQALWVCTHFSKADVEWLSRKQEELIDAAMTCPHSGKRRMILNLICQQPAADPPRVDFLDFCMERMISREEPPGVQSLCMKLAYQLTRSIPELQQELRTILEIMRVANGHFPYMEDFIIVFRSRLGDAGQVVALVVVDVSVVSQFCLMKCTFIDETVLFQYFLRTFIVRITGRCNEAKPQFFKAIVEDTLHCFGHVSFAPI